MTELNVRNMYYLGPQGSNSNAALKTAKKLCNISSQNDIPVSSIRKVLELIQKDYSAFAVLPCENSIEGIVRETVDNMLNIQDGISIKGEITVPIEHALLTKSKDKSGIKLIISHPQALAQCSSFLYKNYPNIPIQEVSSTSYAAQKASFEGNEHLAAIANPACSDIYNLNIIEKNMNDEKDNKTRFYIIGRDELKKHDTGKTAIMLSTQNKSGALCEILQIIANHDINLSCIDSRPSKKKLGEYLFFMELDGFKHDVKISSALEEINTAAQFIKILGSFCSYD